MIQHDDQKPQKPTATLMAEAFAAMTRLLRGELALAQAELTGTLRAMLRGVAYLAFAALLALVGLNLLAGAIVAALIAAGLSSLWATIAACGGFLLLAGGFAQFGMYLLNRARRAAPQAAQNLRRDVATLKDVVTKNAKP